MSVGSPTAGIWSSSQWRPDNEFETDRGVEVVLGCEILNRMTPVGRPMSYRIGR